MDTYAEGKKTPIHVHSGISFGKCQINGFLQTPSGGEPGTTDMKRPTFRELNIDEIYIYNIFVKAGKRKHYFYFSGNIITDSSSGIIQNDLTTHAEFFPAGTRFETYIDLSYYSFGYQYNMYSTETGWHKNLYLLGGLMLWNFDYKISDSAKSTRRDYIHGNGEIGFLFEISRNNVFTSVLIRTALPNPINFSSELQAKYRILKKNPEFFLGFGVSYHYIEHKDSQEVPNHIRAEIGPCVTGGFEIRF